MKKVDFKIKNIIIFLFFFNLNYVFSNITDSLQLQNKNKSDYIFGYDFLGNSLSIIRLNLEYNIYNNEQTNLNIGAGLSLGAFSISNPYFLNYIYGTSNCLEIGVGVNLDLYNFGNIRTGNEIDSFYSNDRLRYVGNIGYRYIDYENNSIWRVYSGFHYINSKDRLLFGLIGFGYSYNL